MADTEAMLAHHYDPDKSDIRGWFASRKLNGYRGVYKPGLGLFSLGRYSGSKQIHCPKWWLEQLPDLSLDGEIWHESDDLAIIKSIAGQGFAKGTTDKRWEMLTFQSFDIRNSQKWHVRQEILDHTPINDIFKVVFQTQVWSKAELEAFCTALGPKVEGAMVANPNGYYEYKRSYNILKYKNSFDYEAYVYDFEPGEGKYDGKIGSLCCWTVWPEHITSVRGGDASMVNKKVYFKMSGMADYQRDIDWFNKTIKDQVVNFTYLGVSKEGVPQSPNFKRVV